MSLTNFYKEYLLKLRGFCLHEPYIIINRDICPMLKHYIKIFDEITFKDGSYHTYYGNIKIIVNSYTKHWTEVMDETIRAADKCSHSINKDKLMTMIENTIDIHKQKQADFIAAFVEFDNPSEKEQFDELQDKYVNCMDELNELRKYIKRLDKQDKIDAFAKKHFPESLRKKNKIFVLTYDFISIRLSLAVDKIKISLEEIFNRLRNNVRAFQERLESSVTELLMRLYEKNKENLVLTRQDVRSSREIAEVKRGMDIIIDKIEDSKRMPLDKLDDEYKYWDKLLREFKQIENTLKKIEQEEKNLLKQEKLFVSSMASKDPEYKPITLEENCGKFRQKLRQTRELKLKAAKALCTFFSVRGDDIIYYSDNIGRYFVDEYGHQVYVFDYGLSIYHVDCHGKFIKYSESNKYYYDENGRYIIEDNKKLYQIQPCVSQYELQDGVFIKHTQDCGHSEKINEKCRMQLKDPNDVVLLPDSVPIDIKGTLTADVIKYLWDALGHVLPDALHDVVQLKPKNPIHCLAHKLLYYKYKRSRSEDIKSREEAAQYRQKIYQGEIERALAQYTSWCAKQGRVHPEPDDHSAVGAHDARAQFIRNLNYYN